MSTNLSVVLPAEWQGASDLPLELVPEVIDFLCVLEKAPNAITELMSRHYRVVKRIDRVLILALAGIGIIVVDLDTSRVEYISRDPIAYTYDAVSITFEEGVVFDNASFIVKMFWPASCTSVHDCVTQMEASSRHAAAPIAARPEIAYMLGAPTIDVKNSSDTTVTKLIDVTVGNLFYLTMDNDIVIISGPKVGFYW